MKITFLSGEHAGSTHEYAVTTITIGREPDNVLILETGGVSRYHAIITCTAGLWSISDLNSTNGIKINGTRQKTSRLNEGDKVTVGEHTFSISEIAGASQEENMLDKFKSPLFNASKSETTDKKESSASGKDKKLFSNRLYYTILACLAVMGITTAVKMFSNSPGNTAKNKASTEEQLETIIFERVKYFDANVFRFAMKLDGNQVTFTVDDAATERHSKEITMNAPPGIDLLKNQIISTGILNKVPDIQPGSRNTYTRIVLISGSKCVDYQADGEALPSSLADISSAIDEFAENCGMITVSRTSEEIMQIASDNFNKAEDLFSNFESSPENLRDAISRYKIADRYLSQYSPPPPMAAKAKQQLIRAEELRSRLLQELKLAETRCLDANQLDELKAIYRKMMMLTDPGTKAFDRTKRKLFKLDRALSGSGGRR